MKGRPFSYDDLFPDRWLHADDLQGREVTLTITAAYQEDLRLPGGSIDACGILSFAKTKREYVLNKSNARVLVALWGKESEGWVGHRITLGTVEDSSGKSASGYRIVFVGSPDIEAPVRVQMPGGGGSRTIKVTKVAKGPSHVDAATGEVFEDAPIPAPVPADGPATDEGDTDPPGMDAAAYKASREPVPDNLLELPQRDGPATAEQLAAVKAARKASGVNASEFSSAVFAAGGEPGADNYGLSGAAADVLIDDLRGRSS